jgi:RNA polymerase sigma factor (sigma-70 family)
VTQNQPLPPPEPGGLQTLEEHLERVRPQIKRLLRSYDIPLQDAEDVLQDALLEAVRKWDTIRHKEAWILGAVRVKCSNYWKKLRNDRILAVEPLVLVELSPAQAPEQEQREIGLDLSSLTRGVGKRHRAALWLRFGVGLDTTEVARRLGYNPSSIRKLTSRSLARLQKQVAAPPAPDDP